MGCHLPRLAPSAAVRVSLQQTFDAYVRALEEVEARQEAIDQQIPDLPGKTPTAPVQYLRCLKGIDTLGALTLVGETQDFRRFGHAPAYMGAHWARQC